MGAPFRLSHGDLRPARRRVDEPRLRHPLRLVLATTMLIVTALALRLYALDRLPGINADEAWYGIAALDWLDSGRLASVTPNGNLPGPLQFGELVLLHTLFEPSPLLLRLPVLLSSIAAVALAFHAGRRIGGPATATLALLTMAVLPINIAYARIGWDPGHSGLLVLLATCLLLSGYRIGSIAIFAVSLLIHPTNLFAAPFLLMVRAGQACEDPSGDRGQAIRGYAIMLLAAVAAFYALRSGSNPMADPAKILPRMFDAGQYADFARRFGDLLTGETVYLYLVGKGMGLFAAPLAWLTVGCLLLLLLKRIDLRRFDVRQGVLVGWVAMLAAFFVLAGPIALRPHFERYGFVLVAPTALALAVMLAPYANRKLFAGLVAGAGTAAIIGFLTCFILPLDAGADDAHRSLRTGPIEPKVAAAEALRRLSAGQPIDVVAEDFWIQLPAEYLLRGSPVRVADSNQAAAGNQWWLVWQGRAADQRLARAGTHRLVWLSADPRGRQLAIWQPK